MDKYPFHVPESTDVEKELVTNPYKAGFHYGVDYKTSHRVALFARTAGVISQAEAEIGKKTKGTKQWIANTRTDPYRVAVGRVFYERALRTEDYGNYVKIDHGKNSKGQTIETLVAHLDEVVVFKNQKVVKGQLIGYSDSTGNSTGNHVHDEIRVAGRVVDPATFDYTFEGNNPLGIDSMFFPLATTVDILSTIDGLKVRSGPGKAFSEAGSKYLTGGTKDIKVSGYVDGELVEYVIDGKKVSSKYWWKSELGNYLWAGGTVQFSDILTHTEVSDKIDSSNNLQKGKTMTQEEKDKVLADIENTAKRIAELNEEVKELEAQKAVLEEKASVEVVEPVIEVPAEVAPEAPVEEVKAEEVVAEDPQKEEARTLIEQLRAKFNL